MQTDNQERLCLCRLSLLLGSGVGSCDKVFWILLESVHLAGMKCIQWFYKCKYLFFSSSQ